MRCFDCFKTKTCEHCIDFWKYNCRGLLCPGCLYTHFLRMYGAQMKIQYKSGVFEPVTVERMVFRTESSEFMSEECIYRNKVKMSIPPVCDCLT